MQARGRGYAPRGRGFHPRGRGKSRGGGRGFTSQIAQNRSVQNLNAKYVTNMVIQLGSVTIISIHTFNNILKPKSSC